MALFLDLADQHQHRLHDIERLEAADDDRLAIVLGRRFVGLGADDGADVRRAEEAVDPRRPAGGEILGVEDMGDGRRRQHVVDKRPRNS